MPGRLMMDDQSNTAESQGLKKDRNHASEAGSSHAVASGNPTQANGVVASGANGVLLNGVSHEGQRNGGDNPGEPSGPPPPLDQSWRAGVENKSLGKLMIRTADKCYSDLTDLIKDMAEQPIAQASGMATPEIDNDEVSLSKKKRLMDFAQAQRERFIRALVINDWAKDAEAFAGIIDVNAFLGKLNACHAGATSAIGEMKLAMNQAKMPNPNIEGAMELLATGKSHGLPDFGYIAPPKLTAKELLRTLKNMNVTLATRLTLHEELPDHFNEYTIADGRATFNVAGEFEVDLAVADEELESSFFYIELRFLFTPAPLQMAENEHNHCEMEVNKAIAAKGLSGCYDILHNFVLTHKIVILRSQIHDLLRGKWFGNIAGAQIRRVLWVQYWVNRPGKKSWIEFGIGSGKPKHGRSRKKPTPIISQRWFQRGVEVEDSRLDIDWHNISLEAILKQAIAKHTSSFLRHVKADLDTLVRGDSGSAATLSTSDHEPDDCEMVLKIPSMRSPIRCFIEPVTGQWTISPPTPATRNAQHVLKHNPTADIPRVLASILSASALEPVENHVSNLDWQQVSDLPRQDNLRAFFGEDLWSRKLFVPSQRWGRSWAIAITVGLGGSRWWIAQLQDVVGTNRRAIINVKRLQVPATTDAVPSRRLLLQIEKAALAEVSYTALAMQLEHEHIKYRLEKPSLIEARSRSRQRTPALFIDFANLMNRTRDKSWKPWAQDLVRLTHQDDGSRTADQSSDVLFSRHDLRLTLREGSFKDLQKHLSQKSGDHDISMNSTGGLAIKLRTPFGVSFADHIRGKLSAIERLNQHLAVLRSCNIKCDAASLSRLSFTYGTAPALSAHLTFPADGNQPTKLRLEPPNSNPHILIRNLLEKGFNSKSPTSFSEAVHVLLLSLPVLSTAGTLQTANSQTHSPVLHIRSTTWYSLKYAAPFPEISFQVRTRTKVNNNKRLVRWNVEQERAKPNAPSLPADLLTSLLEIWNDDGKEWIGLGNGLIADSGSIAAALRKIDEVVRKFRGAVVAAPAPESASAAAPAPAPAPPPVAPQPPQQEVIALD